MRVDADGITANVTEDNVVVLTPQGYVHPTAPVVARIGWAWIGAGRTPTEGDATAALDAGIERLEAINHEASIRCAPAGGLTALDRWIAEARTVADRLREAERRFAVRRAAGMVIVVGGDGVVVYARPVDPSDARRIADGLRRKIGRHLARAGATIHNYQW